MGKCQNVTRLEFRMAFDYGSAVILLPSILSDRDMARLNGQLELCREFYMERETQSCAKLEPTCEQSKGGE